MLACALAASPASTAAQTLRGVVYEGDTSIPIAGANIEVLRADSTREGVLTSDRRGAFELQVSAPGMYLLHASHLSYRAVAPAAVEIGEHEVVTVVLRIGLTAVPLEPLVVTARSADRLAGFYRRAQTRADRHILTREDVDRQRAAVASQLVQRTPGVWLTRRDDGARTLITMRGPGGRCPAVVLLDGLPIAQEMGWSIDEFTSPDLVEGVEIYPPNSAVPSELPAYTNDCGVVAFWSRRSAFRPLTLARVLVAGAIAALVVLGATVF